VVLVNNRNPGLDHLTSHLNFFRGRANHARAIGCGKRIRIGSLFVKCIIARFCAYRGKLQSEQKETFFSRAGESGPGGKK
jgi:hypothetical protein